MSEKGKRNEKGTIRPYFVILNCKRRDNSAVEGQVVVSNSMFVNLFDRLIV